MYVSGLNNERLSPRDIFFVTRLTSMTIALTVSPSCTNSVQAVLRSSVTYLEQFEVSTMRTSRTSTQVDLVVVVTFDL